MRRKAKAKAACRHISLKRATPFIVIRRVASLGFSSSRLSCCNGKFLKLKIVFQVCMFPKSLTPGVPHVSLKRPCNERM